MPPGKLGVTVKSERISNNCSIELRHAACRRAPRAVSAALWRPLPRRRERRARRLGTPLGALPSSAAREARRGRGACVRMQVRMRRAVLAAGGSSLLPRRLRSTR